LHFGDGTPILTGVAAASQYLMLGAAAGFADRNSGHLFVIGSGCDLPGFASIAACASVFHIPAQEKS
jgi:hypothetical protein